MNMYEITGVQILFGFPIEIVYENAVTGSILTFYFDEAQSFNITLLQKYNGIRKELRSRKHVQNLETVDMCT